MNTTNEPLRIFAWRSRPAALIVGISACFALAAIAVSVYSILPNDFLLPDIVLITLLLIAGVVMVGNYRKFSHYQVEVYSDRLAVRNGHGKVGVSVRYQSISAYTRWQRGSNAGLLLHTVHGPVNISAGTENVDDLCEEIDRRMHFTDVFELTPVA